MVLSIRKISFENEELTGAGMLWFPNLNEPDPFLILPITAAMLNYFNLSVSNPKPLFFSYSAALRKKMNIGTLTDLELFSVFCSFSIYRLPTLGQQALSYIGSAAVASCLCSHL
jgi:hypothetical protein